MFFVQTLETVWHSLLKPCRSFFVLAKATTHTVDILLHYEQFDHVLASLDDIHRGDVHTLEEAFGDIV